MSAGAVSLTASRVCWRSVPSATTSASIVRSKSVAARAGSAPAATAATSARLATRQREDLRIALLEVGVHRLHRLVLRERAELLLLHVDAPLVDQRAGGGVDRVGRGRRAGPQLARQRRRRTFELPP